MLEELQTKYPESCAVYYGRQQKSHAKHLVVNEDWCVEGGMNWLSNEGTRRHTRSYNHEAGVLLELPEIAKERWGKVVARYQSWS